MLALIQLNLKLRNALQCILNDHAPISLQTDASDYGVGGYLFQVIDGKEIPIAFISKSLSKIQLR